MRIENDLITQKYTYALIVIPSVAEYASDVVHGRCMGVYRTLLAEVT